MNRITHAIMVCALMMSAGFALTTESWAKKKSMAGGAVLPMSTMAPLTASECERLGGEVYDNPNCKKTGKSCFMSTLNNGDHWVCVNEAN